MRLLPSFWNKTKETWRCLSGRCSILNADQDPHVLVDFAESPTGPAVLAWAWPRGSGVQLEGLLWCKGSCHTPSIPPTNTVFKQMFETNAFFKGFLETLV